MGQMCNAACPSSLSFLDTILAAAAPRRGTGSAGSASSSCRPAPSAGNGTPSAPARPPRGSQDEDPMATGRMIATQNVWASNDHIGGRHSPDVE